MGNAARLGVNRKHYNPYHSDVSRDPHMAGLGSAILSIIAPNSKGKAGGIAATGTYSPQQSQNILTAPTHQDHLTDIFSSGQADDARKTMAAVMPDSLSAPVNVVVFQCPCGIGERHRSPQMARPRSRDIFVLRPVSSMKTRCAGSKSSWPPNQSWRRFRRSGRSCSSACAVF